jgi:hypothetical protein
VVSVGGRDFGRHWPFDCLANLSNDVTDRSAGPCDMRRVGRYAIEDARRSKLPDLQNIGCIDKEFHLSSP